MKTVVVRDIENETATVDINGREYRGLQLFTACVVPSDGYYVYSKDQIMREAKLGTQDAVRRGEDVVDVRYVVPSWTSVKRKVLGANILGAGTLSPMERFVFDNEPEDVKKCNKFRKQLQAVLDELKP